MDAPRPAMKKTRSGEAAQFAKPLDKARLNSSKRRTELFHTSQDDLLDAEPPSPLASTVDADLPPSTVIRVLRVCFQKRRPLGEQKKLS